MGRWSTTARQRTYWWRQMGVVGRFAASILPAVDQQLSHWQARARQAPDPLLREQALASLRWKRFHAQGGSVYAAAVGQPWASTLVTLIVALQTISDYLDNLCDRAGCQDEAAFRQLHQAMLDALDPAAPSHDYYAHYAHRDDGGYLRALVETCQRGVAVLPSYAAVAVPARRLVSLYCDLQVYKHIDPAARADKLQAWLAPLVRAYPQLTPWELAAATGSTLGVFALFRLATRRSVPLAWPEQVAAAYFPWIGGLHILLDYLIDLGEDAEGGDFNFVARYADLAEAKTRMGRLVRRAAQEAVGLPDDPALHLAVVNGLLGMYLSDPKVRREGLGRIAAALVREAGLWAGALRALCGGLRRLGRV